MRHYLALALTCGGLGLSITTDALAVGGAVNISGRIMEDSCLVSLDEGLAGTSSLALPALSRQSLTRNSATPMTMELSDCPTQAHMRTWFEPLGMDSSTGNLANMAVNAPATNVQVQITDGSGRNAIAPHSSRNLYASLNEETITLSYAAQYIAVGGAAQTGNVESHVIYTVEYL